MENLIHESLASAVPSGPLRAAIIIAAAFVAAKLSTWILTGWVRLWARRTSTDLDDRLLEILHRPVLVSITLLGLWLAAIELELPPLQQLVVLRTSATIAIVLWSSFGFRFLHLTVTALGRLGDRFEFVQPRTVPLFENVGRVLLFGAAAYAFFLTWGIDVTGWLATAGIVGIAVGFAAKDSLANLFGGVFILADAPYEMGDFIVLDSGERGEVTGIGLRSTRLLTRDDVEITIPNAVIANAKITNQSGGPWEKFRVRVQVGVAYGSDVDLVKRVLLEAAASVPEIVEEPAARVRFRAFGDSSLNFELLGWVDRPVLRGLVLDALNTAVYKRFNAEGVEIPFPQRDLWVKQWPGSPDPDSTPDGTG